MSDHRSKVKKKSSCLIFGRRRCFQYPLVILRDYPRIEVILNSRDTRDSYIKENGKYLIQRNSEIKLEMISALVIKGKRAISNFQQKK